MLKLTETDVFNYLTIGSHSYSLCQKQWTSEEKKMLTSVDDEDKDKFIRKCLTAGRTELLSHSKPVKIYNESGLSMVDVVSLYPTVMMDENNHYPAGDSYWVEKKDDVKLGFYEVVIRQNSIGYNVLPKRDFDDKTKALDWKCKEQYTTFCTSVDI